MNMESENQLRELFAELRHRDEQATPSFDSRTDAAQRLPRAAHGYATQLAMAAAVVILLMSGFAVANLRSRARAIESELEQWTALSHWQAATDTFLAGSRMPWSGRLETPTDSLIDVHADLANSITEKL
jgi:hypothetical protein